MNKKFLSVMLIVLCVGFVSAGIGYYALFSTSFDVVNSIEVGGSLDQELEGTYFSGQTIPGEEITLKNLAPSERQIVISNDAEELEDNIEVSYVSTLELTKKDVNFELSVWNIPDDAEKVQIEYTIIGNEFSAEVTTNPKEGYVLIYYADNDDRFANPGEAVLVEDVVGNLPAVDDENTNLNDYSVEYPTTPHGAKIWYVPQSALTEGVIDWNRASDFYFESALIHYNAQGELTIYS